MSRNWIEIIAGALVLILALGFLAFIVTSTRSAARFEGYELLAQFGSVEGVREGSDIRMSGISIGRVGEIVLNREEFMAETTLMIENDIKIPTDSVAKIATEGLLGGAFVEIIPGAELVTLEEGASFTSAEGALSVIDLFIQFGSGAGAQ